MMEEAAERERESGVLWVVDTSPLLGRVDFSGFWLLAGWWGRGGSRKCEWGGF